ncbi:MAG: hypothetical protein AAB468_01560 [Patescibacteria group bacterium]
MTFTEPESGVEQLKKKLYQRSGPPAAPARSQLEPALIVADDGWPNTNKMSRPRKKRSFLFKILLLAATFFVISLALAMTTFFRGDQWVSAANIDLKIEGPQAISAGEEVDWAVSVTNRNQSPLTSVELVVIFPPGTHASAAGRPELLRSSLKLGDLKPGETLTRSVKAIIFGEQDAVREVTFSLEYRIAGSGAIFDKRQIESVKIGSAPVAIIVDLPSEENSNREFVIKAEVVSRAAAPINDLVLIVDYPPGFVFRSASPAPTIGDHVWRLGDLPAAGRFPLTVLGAVAGQDDEEKTFRFDVGSAAPTAREVDILYSSVLKTLAIRRPEVGLELTINGQTNEVVPLAGGEIVRTDVSWLNNLSEEIRDASLEIVLRGAALDRGSVSAGGGFYDSAASTITWRSRDGLGLEVVPPAVAGQASFSFATSFARLNANTSPELEIEVIFRGRHIVAERDDEPVEIHLSRRVRINSFFQFSGKSLYQSSYFTAAGPLPPRVDQETFYTIVWSVVNWPSEVGEATLRATLPPYVKWLDKVAPAGETVTYDSTTGEVAWQLGVVPAGRGSSAPAREAAFQVAMRPSATQVGQTPALVSTATLSGRDSFTGERLEHRRAQLTIELPGDSSVSGGHERVVP